ncbi:HNH endonuclease signature motif containing protein [Leucobacter ruminantium]|uniref:DUF222 domain-containing protein n=1 Tax=Leucobacter ruminantium TaxID=1289170 RepID=A0A939LV71_9MICO|nr:HNH endonuclease signature motif containing protein [Leucobacter ruminantium]MBO1804706.1 DUF222 domain-containing protein [Leucobacter ruminantium]
MTTSRTFDTRSGAPGAGAAGAVSEAHPLEEVLGWLERIESQQRASDAARIMLIATAMDQTVGAPAGGSAAASRSGAAAGSGAASGPGAPSGSGTATELAYRSLRAELAAAFNISEYEAERQMDLAHRLSHQYAATLAALDRTEISYAHARVIATAGLVIGAGDSPELRRRRAGYEGEILEVAVRETPGRLRPIARRLAERWAERSLDERHREAVVERRVCIVDGEDGMAELFARLPALEAHAIYDRLTRIARAAERGERRVPARGGSENEDHAAPNAQATREPEAQRGREPAREPARETANAAETPPARTRDQLRADAFADLLLSADEFSLFAGSTGESVRANVQIIVSGQASRAEQSPRTSADGAVFDAGADAELAGFGPMDGATARCVSSEAEQWDEVVLDPATGNVLSVDRYRPSERMRRLLGTRDRHCRFPGCRVPVSRCDLDHTVDAAHGGSTATDNLAHLCRGHHVLKHHAEWRVSQESGGALRWRSPTGREYVDRPLGAMNGGACRAGPDWPAGQTRPTGPTADAGAPATAAETASETARRAARVGSRRAVRFVTSSEPVP